MRPWNNSTGLEVLGFVEGVGKGNSFSGRYFLYSCDTSEVKHICIGRKGEGFHTGKHEKGYC
jgi:hypothetical protein